MLKFNTFRPDRYLRSKFIEGRYFLASEATDLELEILDYLRKATQTLIGDIAVQDAWEVSRLSATSLLIKPGEAWFKGLPFSMRSGKDQLVSGASLTLGIVPPGVTVTDDSTGLGKILTFTAASTPTNLYKLVVTAFEEIVTDIEDPFLKNANITESTAQKVRLKFQINVVTVSTQSETPVPYTPDTGAYNVANLVNQILVTPGVGQNGELISTNSVSGSSNIDGRDIELTIRNDTSLGGGVKIPNGTTDQQAFYNGKFIDSVGNIFHINAIFNDTISTQVIIRLDKEVGQPNPVIQNGTAYTLIKRDVYATDDINGNPVGKIFWPIANVNWHTTNGFVHSSVVTDLRERVLQEEEFEDVVNQKFNIQATGGGVIDVDTDGETLNWSSDFTLINPSGPSQTIAAGSAVLLEGGTLTYEMDFAGGAIEVGPLAVTVSGNVGPLTSFSGGPDLSLVKVGNVLKVGSESVAITAIDNVNKTVSVTPDLTSTGAGTIYRDSFAEGTVALKENLFVLAVRQDNKIRVANDLELSAGESNAIYDVRLLYPAGLPALTNITLPDNSITGKPQFYQSTKRNLEVYQNQLLKFQGVDWTAIDEQTIRFAYALPVDTEIHFRIDSLPAGSVGGGGGGGGASDLQSAYNGGNTIAASPGLPFTVSGTGKVAEFQGDITVTGLIDPTGLELTPQASSPITPTKQGIWANTANQLIFDNGTTSENVSQRLDDLEDGTSNPITAGDGLTKTGNDLDVNVDDSTIEIFADVLRVKDLGITTAKIDDDAVTADKIAASVAGDGLAGGAGSPLSVNVDDSTIEIDTDALQVKDSGITTPKIANAAVDADKLAASVAGAGILGGAGTPLAVGAGNGIQVNADSVEVLHSPSNKITAQVGESFAANTTFLVRWGVNGESADRVYKATNEDPNDKKYLVFGLLLSAGSLVADDPATIVVTGTHTLGSLDTPFAGADIGKEVYLTSAGGFTVVPPTTVGDAQYRIGIVKATNQIWVDVKQLNSIVPEPVYDERLLYPAGLASATDITLPNNSRNGGAAQTYSAASGRLKIYLNQQLKFQGIDWTIGTSPTTQIKFNYALPVDAEVHFRMDPLASGVVNGGGGGGGGGTLQDAYDSGSTINITSGVPLTINGPVSQKLLVINGDIEVTGVIDPTAIQLTPQASNPLGAGKGLWIDSGSDQLMFEGSTTQNITQVIEDVESGMAQTSISKEYTNNTGSLIPMHTPVYSPVVGEVAPADGSDNSKFRIIGITTEHIADGAAGLVAISGIIEGVSSLDHNTYAYLGLTPGTITDEGPTLGPYPSGFQVVRLGVVEGTNLLLQIQHVGTL